MTGIGGFINAHHLHNELPVDIVEGNGIHIAHFNMWAILVGLTVWKAWLWEKWFIINCNKKSVAQVINLGAS